MTKLFIIDRKNPWKPIRELECEIFAGKRAWVRIKGVRRHLIGSTAFFTEASAEAARIGCAARIVKSGYQKVWHEFIHTRSDEFLKERKIFVKVEHGPNHRNEARSVRRQAHRLP